MSRSFPIDENFFCDGHAVVLMSQSLANSGIDPHELVLDAELPEESLNQTGLVLLCPGEEPYGHRLPSLHLLKRTDELDPVTLGLFGL